VSASDPNPTTAPVPADEAAPGTEAPVPASGEPAAGAAAPGTETPPATEPSDHPASSGGTPDPEQLRAEIEETRRELGETVAALSAKTDVKAQAHHKVDEVKAAVEEKREELLGKKDELLGRAREVSPDSALSAASSTSAKVRQNPLPAAVAGAFVGGFLLGRLTASRED
jgi:ElaB/YqjD/DUF883 family membrane-anchored ribosome-binding protein